MHSFTDMAVTNGEDDGRVFILIHLGRVDLLTQILSSNLSTCND